jgi:hypothetical protein
MKATELKDAVAQRYHLLTTDDVAQRLTTTPRIVDSLRKSGKIPYVQLNRKIIRFDWPQVEAAIKALTKDAVSTGKRAASKLKVLQ